MSLVSIFLQAEIGIALVIFTISSTLLLPLAYIAENHLPSRLLQWQWEHVAMPLLRILLLLLFIVMAWPELYGIQSGPALDAVLTPDSGRSITLVNLLFVLAMLLPLIPVLGDWHVLTLPLQGITAVALLFNWMPDSQATLSVFWPGWLTVFTLVVVAWVAYQVSVLAGEYLGQDVDAHWHVTGSHEMISNILLLILQAPIIIIYAHSLGTHLN